MVDTTEDFDMEAEDKVVGGSENQIESVYPKAEEDLLDFLHCCRAKDLKVIIFPRCGEMFEKKNARKMESTRQVQQKENWKMNKP